MLSYIHVARGRQKASPRAHSPAPRTERESTPQLRPLPGQCVVPALSIPVARTNKNETGGPLKSAQGLQPKFGVSVRDLWSQLEVCPVQATTCYPASGFLSPPHAERAQTRQLARRGRSCQEGERPYARRNGLSAIRRRVVRPPSRQRGQN